MFAEALQSQSTLAWIYLNKFRNENQKPLEFENHRFMIDIYADDHPDIVCRKSAQVGFSVYSILKSFHELKYEKRNVIYALPTKNVVQDFVVPKVNPLIVSNPAIVKDMGSDSVSLKRLGDRFIYFKGGSEREAISVSADTLVIDEYDRMPDMNIVTMFDSRLQAAEKPRRRRFSNPSAIGFGVDGLYNDSDQMHWLVTCHSCGHSIYMDFERDELLVGSKTIHTHYIDQKRQIYACGECHEEITNQDRRNGQWQAKYPDRARRGYWISQMMAPWVSARRILQQKEEMDVATFHAFVLGKAYTPSDLIVNRATILSACNPSMVDKREVVLGSDSNIPMTWVLMTPDGIFDHGRTESWDDLERLKLMYNALWVMDPNPYPTVPKQMVDKYKGSAYICYFKQDTKNLGIIQYGTGVNASVVYADRTKLLDLVAQEKVDGKMIYREPHYKLEDIIADWENIYRTTEEKDDGRVKSVWIKKEGKTSDYPFAEAYARIGLSKLMGRGAPSGLVRPPVTTSGGYIDSKGGYVVDLSQDLAEAFEE